MSTVIEKLIELSPAAAENALGPDRRPISDFVDLTTWFGQFNGFWTQRTAFSEAIARYLPPGSHVCIRRDAGNRVITFEWCAETKIPESVLSCVRYTVKREGRDVREALMIAIELAGAMRINLDASIRRALMGAHGLTVGGLWITDGDGEIGLRIATYGGNRIVRVNLIDLFATGQPITRLAWMMTSAQMTELEAKLIKRPKDTVSRSLPITRKIGL